MQARRTLIAAAVTVAFVASLTGPAGADHEFRYEPTTTEFFMRNSAAGCPGDPWLGISAGANEPGCGYQGGAPFGELYHLGLVASTIKTYTTREGTPQYLDPSRDVTGNVRVVATATSQRRALGQVRVDVTLRARTQAGQNVVLGTHTSETIVVPDAPSEADFPFTMDLAGSAALDKVPLTELSVDVDIRGWHVLHGYHRLNGESWLNLPAYLRIPIPHE